MQNGDRDKDYIPRQCLCRRVTFNLERSRSWRRKSRKRRNHFWPWLHRKWSDLFQIKTKTCLEGTFLCCPAACWRQKGQGSCENTEVMFGCDSVAKCPTTVPLLPRYVIYIEKSKVKVSDANFLVMFYSNCGSVLLSFRDMTPDGQQTEDGNHRRRADSNSQNQWRANYFPSDRVAKFYTSSLRVVWFLLTRLKNFINF